MISLTQESKDRMARLNNAIVDLLDKSECGVLEACFVLKNIHDRIETTALLPRKIDKKEKPDSEKGGP